ncbi:MAG: hypothetical protein ACRDRH_26250 [Pseudonocardia sp.]
MHADGVSHDVPDDCVVYRVVKREDVKGDGTPGSGSFSDKAGEDGSHYYMSVYFEDEMRAAGKNVNDLQNHWNSDNDRYIVYQFAAAELRVKGEKLWREPNDEFPGHGACKRCDDSERTRGQKRSLAKLAKPATS